MIKLIDIVKIYKTTSVKTVALDKFNLEIEKGDFIAIMGTSGSGKSTLLNIIGGMDKPTSGEYIFEDEHIEKYNSTKLDSFRRDNIGFIFQNFALMNHFTVFENLEMPLKIRE